MEELRGGALARAFPRSPPETRSAKEAKETDRLWWKTPRLSCGGRRGIAVRTKWLLRGRNAVCRCSLPCVGRVDGGTTRRVLARMAP